MYVLAKDSQVVKFPYSLGDLQKDNPNVSFSLPLSASDLSEFDVYEVEFTLPQYDELTQEAEESGPVFNESEGKWKQGWKISELSPEKKYQKLLLRADYRKFYNELISSSVYQKIRQQALTSLPLTVAATEFIAAMTDAKAGMANKDAIQACFDNILAAASLDQSDLQSIGVMLSDAKMSDIYTLGN